MHVRYCIFWLVISLLGADLFADDKEEGQYLAHIAACGSCHGKVVTDPESTLSGGLKIKDEFGIAYVPNITSSTDYGVGSWTNFDILNAIRASIGPENRKLSISSHEGYRWMSDEDANSIVKYIRSLKPLGDAHIERRDLNGLKTRSWGLIEKHDELKGYVPAAVKSSTGYYGLYLVNNVMACSRCHSPKNRALDDAKYLSGGKLDWYSLNGEELEVPSIRYNDSGIGSWSESDLEKFITSGIKKNGQKVSSDCPQVYFSVLNEQDRKAVISYLKSLK